MPSRLKQAAKRHPWLTGAFALALALFVVFAVRAALFAMYWSDPAKFRQPIEGWMTPRYVATSWRIPRPEMDAALGEAMPPKGVRLTLNEIAKESGVPLEVLIERIEAAAPPPKDRP